MTDYNTWTDDRVLMAAIARVLHHFAVSYMGKSDWELAAELMRRAKADKEASA